MNSIVLTYLTEKHENVKITGGMIKFSPVIETDNSFILELKPSMNLDVFPLHKGNPFFNDYLMYTLIEGVVYLVRIIDYNRIEHILKCHAVYIDDDPNIPIFNPKNLKINNIKDYKRLLKNSYYKSSNKLEYRNNAQSTIKYSLIT